MSQVILGDCVEELKKLPENSVDSIVTDPPYGLEFMGKEWDSFKKKKGKKSSAKYPGQTKTWTSKEGSGIGLAAPRFGTQSNEDMRTFQSWTEEWAREALRVLKPGGHLIAFGGTRTYHRLACAIEDAGFEIRDQIQWLYGSGFPKSLNVGKAIDKKRYDGKETIQVTKWINEQVKKSGRTHKEILAAFGFNEGSGQVGHWTATTKGSQPSVPTLDQVPKLLEVLGVKPEEVPEDIARLLFELNGEAGEPGENWFKREVVGKSKQGKLAVAPGQGEDRSQIELDITAPATEEAARWEGWGTALKPANEPCVLARKPFRGTVAENVLEHGTGAINIEEARIGGKEGRWPANVILDEEAGELLDEQSGIKEGPARFFYCPKAGKKERNAGIEDGNKHPTVKPVKLMAYLIRLVTPPGGTVLDPFLGSGSTALAAIEEGFSFIGIEKDPEYIEIAKARIKHWEEEAAAKEEE